MKRTIQFTPSIKTEWAGTLDYISDSEKIEIMNAMFGYPEINCQSQFWIKTIKPEFDRQLSDFQDYCESQSRKASQRWERKSMPRDTTAIPRDAVGMPPKISKDKISKDNKGGVGGKEEPDNVSNVSKVSSPLKEKFIAPTIEEVLTYATERNCTPETAQKFFDYYSTQGWKDSKGNKVKNWKGKFIAIWDKPENKIQPEVKFWL